MNATEMPAAGSSTFAFYTSGAPPSAKGWLVIAGEGATLPLSSLDPQASSRAVPVQADGQGWVETPYPLTSASPGETFRARSLFRNTPACLGQGGWSRSNALRVTVQ